MTNHDLVVFNLSPYIENMGNKSKSTQACLENLTKALAKFCKTTVKECTDSEDSLTYKPGPDDDMYDFDKDGSEFEEADIADDAQLLTCSGPGTSSSS